MRLDAHLVKERVSLKELFERDGYELRKQGNDYLCRCPFHEEKTASCVVHEDQGYFKCFGCDAGGDCFVYWQEKRKVEFSEALKALAMIAGVSSSGGDVRPMAKPAPQPQKEEMLAQWLEGPALQPWTDAVERLKDNRAAQERIAEWRGYHVRTIEWAIEKSLIGLIPLYGMEREVFLVERPHEENHGRRVPVGWHIRLGPRTPGNVNDRQSWRFNPTGIGSWPFVAGDVFTARILFIVEGQWDALALIDLLWVRAGLADKENLSGGVESRHADGNAKTDSDSDDCPAMIQTPVPGKSGSSAPPAQNSFIDLPSTVAVIGMRGASSWRRFVQHYFWRDYAVAFVIADADTAGTGWVRAAQADGQTSDEATFMDVLRSRCERAWSFWPNTESGKDLNDLTKAGLIDPDELRDWFRTKLQPRGRGRRKAGPTFLQFCRTNKTREDEIGAIARTIVADTRRPSGRKPLRVWEQQYLSRFLPEQQHQAFYHAWKEYAAA